METENETEVGYYNASGDVTETVDESVEIQYDEVRDSSPFLCASRHDLGPLHPLSLTQ